MEDSAQKTIWAEKAQSFITNHVEESDIGEVLKSLLPCSG